MPCYWSIISNNHKNPLQLRQREGGYTTKRPQENSESIEMEKDQSRGTA